MKICPNCQAIQQDNRTFCVDCGAKLGKSISRSEETAVCRETEKQMEKLYHQTDPLYVSISDRIGGTLGLALAAAWLVFWLAAGKQKSVLPPFYGLLPGLLDAAEAFFPQIGWELEKLRLSFSADGTDELTPSGFYRWSRKIFIWLCALLSLAALVEGIFAVIRK